MMKPDIQQVPSSLYGQSGHPDAPNAVFIDSIDGDKASVMAGDHQMVVPVELLPKGAKEGDWVDAEAGKIVPPPHDDANDMRSKMAAGDHGGPIDLGGPGPDRAQLTQALYGAGKMRQ